MKDVLEAMVRLLSQGESLVLATLFTRSGSAPRAAGTRMVVRADGATIGTVGGGLVEAGVRECAANVLRDRNPVVLEFVVTREDASTMDATCGGQVEVLIEFVDPADSLSLDVYRELLKTVESEGRAWLLTALSSGQAKANTPSRCLIKADGTTLGTIPAGVTVGIGQGSPIGLFSDNLDGAKDLLDLTSTRRAVVVPCGQVRMLIEPVYSPGAVVILGAGHISQKLAPLCELVGFEVAVADDRHEYANRERFRGSEQIVLLESFEDAFCNLSIDGESYVVIMTRGHVHDQTALAQTLRTNACYIGMIGSRAKREAMYRVLAGQGFGAQDLARVHTPVGLNIGAETPEEIAVSIVAELIQVRAERKGKALSPSHPEPSPNTEPVTG